MRLTPQKRQEEFGGLDEVVGADGDREVDRIEVGLATEATAKIRLGVDRRLRLPAVGTDEHESPITTLVWPVQVPDQPIDWNLVTQSPQEVVVEPFPRRLAEVTVV
jgi:hypothetical protein